MESNSALLFNPIQKIVLAEVRSYTWSRQKQRVNPWHFGFFFNRKPKSINLGNNIVTAFGKLLSYLAQQDLFFYPHRRKIKSNYLLGHITAVIGVVTVEDQASLFPVRIIISSRCFAQCKFKADERTCCCSSSWLYTFRWFTPSPFPREHGKGGGRGREYMSRSCWEGRSFHSWLALVLELYPSFSQLQLLS